MKPTSLFRPTERLPKELKGLTAELLADLYDIVEKFGTDVAGSALKRLKAGGDKEMYFSVVVPPAKYLNMVVGTTFGTVVRNCHVFMIEDGNHSFVLWDKRISVEDVRAFIAELDAEMRECGAVDPETGACTRVVSDIVSPGTLKADEVFAERGKLMAFMGESDPEDVKRMFDRPEDVCVLGDISGSGRIFYCHRRDLPRFMKRDDAVARVLERWGLKNQADIDGLSRADVQRLLAEVNRELETMDN